MGIFEEAENEGIWRSNASIGRKFFVTFPYPYMNGFLHLGHLYTLMKAEVMARYKRMAGYSTLFPFAFHGTGMPIVAAAQRIAEGEEKQKRILESMGIPEEEIPKFSEPRHWIEFFPEEAKKDLKALGLSVDWRRSFVTVFNKHYSAFIAWQFRKLKEKGFVAKGRHPVVWCPKDRTVVGDHARLKGEGVMPQEMTVIKFRAEKDGKEYVLPAATLRPETVFGVTNIWANPEVDYVVALVNGERWVVSREAAEKLGDQGFDVEILDEKVDVFSLDAENPVNGRKVPVLRASFVDPEFGTGIVMSVPGHAPYDYVALKQSGAEIEPVLLIEVDGKEGITAEEVERLGITDQNDERLEELTAEIYRKEFHRGIMNNNAGEFAGMPVKEAKEKIAKMLVEKGDATKMYELPEEVVCRCLTKCHVKVVDNQWFLKYSLPEWKEMARKAVERMGFYPASLKEYFMKVVDWLSDWACARKFGLGTRLPWDPEWVIESLSDSTIYMAYYTIAHLITRIENPEDDLFDYVFLGKGDREELSKKYDMELLERMREEFEYWYPLDLRVSGKDLIQNHLTMMIFNHVAIFPEEKWPRSIAVNGHVLVDGEKMSKSKGNFLTIRQLLSQYGADPVRFVAAYAGEGIDDANFDTGLCSTMRQRLSELESLLFPSETRQDRKRIDDWLEWKIKEEIGKATISLEKVETRTALQHIYFNVISHLKWYFKRDVPNAETIEWVRDAWLRSLSPFVPETAEKLWRKAGKDKWVWLSQWPVFEYSEMPDTEEFIRELLADARNVMGLAERKGAKAEKMTIFIAEPWKWELAEMGKTMEMGEIRKKMASAFSENGKVAARIVQDAKKGKKYMDRELQMEVLEEAREFLSRELGIDVEIRLAEESESEKARASTPFKPGILVE